MKKFLLYFFIIIIFLINIYLRFYKLNIPGINADEAWVGWTSKSIYEDGLLKYITGMGNYTGVLYSYITSYFYRIFSPSIETSRLAGNFFMFLLIPATIFIFKKYNKGFLSILLLMLTLNPYLLMFGRWAMPHALIPFFSFIFFYFNYLFIKDKKIIYLLLAFFIAGLSIQLLPLQILLIVFLIISNIIFNKKYFMNIIKTKIFIIIIILFIISTSSVIIYNSKEVFRIIEMNLGYLSSFGFIEIIKIIIERIPIYFIKFFDTFNGFISIVYFSGQLSLNTFLQSTLKIISIIIFFISFYHLKSGSLLKKINALTVYFLFFSVPVFLEFFNQNMHFPRLGEERYLLIFYPNVIIMFTFTIYDFFKKNNKIFKTASLLVLFIYLYSWSYIISIDFFRHFSITGGTGIIHFYLTDDFKDPKIAAYKIINNDNTDNKIIISQDYWIYWIIKYYADENIIVEWIPNRRHPREFRANFNNYKELNDFYKDHTKYYILWDNIRNEEEEMFFKNIKPFKNVKRIDNEIILNIYKF